MKKYVNGQYVDMTPEEIAQAEHMRKTYEAMERHRPFTPEEVSQMIIKQQINQIAVDDQTSLRMRDYYPTFDEVVGQQVKKGFKFTYEGELYKTVQADLTIQGHHQPTAGMESLYERIDEIHAGDAYDPIPYKGNMALMNTKHYSQNGVTYLCNRDTGIPVHQPLSELVGLYVTNLT